ncbi:hypothetical protein A2865_01615 [Candidatus Woesebacteria bacterium RIFCSPHIGHO2_01_FULL_39_17]|uniref:Addiction module toxin, HicA family n=1 Tax=Candidatus Woesebacteria bacterium RIFCSPLOWO2_01_FULL_39_14 TaxID=1802518 RepID=A0A1F8BC50_9BACT|nr:MAG: hypothetical protein A2865_01615 [Candidatus Woesebacteria bacterium RIFCSPHIGHO2_01_FULL_39_17]OGM61637.1 MAG: hypothetical protein A3A52_02745 [Candidatus Woesebacteria bacterium RIFCSPLOWO2_01_FULL_39_14]
MIPIPYRRIIKKARRAGFILRRKTSGTHEIWWNEKTRKTCVIHHHKEIKAGTLQKIICIIFLMIARM